MSVRPLHEQRLDAVAADIAQSRARTVLDLGCGTGRLLNRLLRMPRLAKVIGLDSSASALAAARARLSAHRDRRLVLIQCSFVDGLDHFSGIDAATLVESIEHIPPDRLSALEAGLFGVCRPATVLVTTPNREHKLPLRQARRSASASGPPLRVDKKPIRALVYGYRQAASVSRLTLPPRVSPL
jgi:ubiquinone/menaquinone biosynthesis C-methylase UbiE